MQTLMDTKTALRASQRGALPPVALPECKADDRNNTKQTKRCVQFHSDFHQFYPTLHMLEYTFEEKRSTWYNLDDLDEIKKERRSTIKRMNKGSKLKKGQHTRGLEAYTREGSKVRQQIITDSIQAVKAEQLNQKMKNSLDSHRIAQAYGTYSRPCQLAAYERGLSDKAAMNATDIGMSDDCEQRQDVASDVAVGWTRS